MPRLPLRASKRAVVRAPRVVCLLGLLIAPLPAAAQSPSPTVTGTLTQVWGDPAPAQPGGPRVSTVIVSADGQRSTEVVLPSGLAEPHGGLAALIGRTVSATLTPRVGLGAAVPAPPTVTAITVAAALGGVSQAYAPAEGAQRWVAIPCRYADNSSFPVTPEYLHGLLGEGPATIGQYWKEVSYGKVQVYGQALRWRPLPKPQSSYVTGTSGDPNLNLLANDCLDAADAEVDFTDVAGVLLVFNGPVGCCAWGGGISIARDGVSKSIGVTWLPAGWATAHNVVGHEMGHAFGLAHLRDVGTTGPRWDIMASGATCTPTLPVGCRAVHTSAPHKEQLGWIEPARRLTLAAGTTETVLLESLAMPPSQGAYLTAIVPLGREQLFIESRWRRGYDAGVPGDAVVIYRVDPSTSERTAIVDVDGNGDRNDAGAMWLPGETYTDPGSGVTVRVDAVTALGHVVTIARPAAVPPSNTSCLTAREVTTFPFSDLVGTEAIADEGGLPYAACAPVPARSLWYRITAPADGTLWAYTTGSQPAAQASLWKGACGRLGNSSGPFCGGSWSPAATAGRYLRAGEVVYLIVSSDGRETGTLAVQTIFGASPPSLNSCITALTPTNTDLPVQGGTLTLAVQAPADCSWYLSDNESWITPVGVPRGTGSGSATFTVSPNAGPGRASTVWHSSQSVNVLQTGCAIGDDDCDGLPTAWERAVGLDPSSAVGAHGATGDPDGDGLRNADERLQQSHPRGTFIRYFAEGATGAFFNARLALANPGTEPVRALLRFLTAGGVAATLPVTVAPQQRVSVNPETLPGLSSAEFATVVEADALVVADRHMQWGGVGYGSHAETAIAAPSRTWYLAEGSTVGSFTLFYLLQNPSASETAQVRVRYLLPDGAPLEKTYDLAPSSRFNIWVDEELFGPAGKALASTDVSAAIEVIAGPAIIVERAMYLTRPGEVFGAGHESAGVVAPATTWFLAEGATGAYFDEFVLIANPSGTAADVEVRYLLPDGTVHTVRHAVPAAARYNIWLDQETVPGLGKVLADTALSVTLQSLNGVPIVVERAMWWPGSSDTWLEAHNSPGATASGTRWGLAEGEVGGPSELDTYVLVANVSAAAGLVRVTLLFEDATTATREFVVAPQSRFNVWVREEFPQARGRRFGAIVQSLGAAPAQLVVERAMYGNALGVQWAAGTNALGVRLSP
jgi:M6 family metalloprotease-like protein